jgi:6-pyruvoyltetrahydropterin/6-carboxytetrahydropterin synthase
MIELSKSFYFDAAHTLHRKIDAVPSKRIHGHTYRAEVSLRGEPDPANGMLIDLAFFVKALEGVRDALDHHFLDEVEGLGPATMENLARFIWRKLADMPGLYCVSVYRDAAHERARYWG